MLVLWAVSSLKRNTRNIADLEFSEHLVRSSEAKDLARAVVQGALDG